MRNAGELAIAIQLSYPPALNGDGALAVRAPPGDIPLLPCLLARTRRLHDRDIEPEPYEPKQGRRCQPNDDHCYNEHPMLPDKRL